MVVMVVVVVVTAVVPLDIGCAFFAA
ncbi:MAG: hypothetical protein QOI58_4088, partial [Thermoanaerobaculia bacterium]|nr:hypothetical protein [Thermoanaerobaculia bacterium]